MFTEESYTDVTDLMLRISSDLCLPVTNLQWFAFPGAERFSSDAALHVVKDPNTDVFIQAEVG